MKNQLTASPRRACARTAGGLLALLAAGSLRGVEVQPAKGTPPSAVVRGPYFGQEPPGKTPKLFAPGILSRPDRMEARVAFSPDGNECFFTVPSDFNFSRVQLYYTRRVDDGWTPQALAPFTGPDYLGAQPFFSADGNKLFFTFSRNGHRGIWVVERTSNGWSDPRFLPAPINSPRGAGEYSQTTDGTAYVESDRPGGSGKIAIWRFRPQSPGGPYTAEVLGPPVNSGTYNSDPFVAPDGSYLIFSSDRAGGCGGTDLYVTFADGQGGWTAPVNLNEYCPGTNTAAIEYGASLSPDERYLFFVRLSYEERTCDVYWVDNPVRELAAARSKHPSGPYFGEPPPGDVPVLFAPGFLAPRFGFAARIAFSPDGRECLVTAADPKFSRPKIWVTELRGDTWTEPVVAPFTAGHFRSNEPFFSLDGNRLYFSSDPDGKSETNRRDIWMVERTPQGWGRLQRLPPPLNSDFTELFFSQAANGTIYFISNRPGGLGGFDLYRARPNPDRTLRVENLGAPLNSAANEWDPCVAPDESFLIFASERPGGRGGSDLYVSFADGRGGWIAPVNLGDAFNSPGDEYAPSLSPDARYLFFTRYDGKRGQLYWVRTAAIDRFRPASSGQ